MRPVRLVSVRDRGDTRLTLVAASGTRINARLKPVLQLEDGSVLRFDAPRRTPDSAYFVDAPGVEAVLPDSVHRGLVRASVCNVDERVCRTVSWEVNF